MPIRLIYPRPLKPYADSLAQQRDNRWFMAYYLNLLGENAWPWAMPRLTVEEALDVTRIYSVRLRV